jgi:hypothetical protein
MLKKLLPLVALVLLPGYSYSDSITPYYGSTGNAVTDQSLRWSMDNVLPGPPGLDINGVIYNYTIQKETGDHVDVYVQNENATGTGYIFREHDEWRPGSLGGTQINKVVPVVPTNRALWGDGSIEVQGPGSVTDANVVYTYTVDPCYDPQFNPGCPGYKPPKYDIPGSDYEIYDVMNDPFVDLDRSRCKPGETDGECLERLEEEELSEEELAEKEAEEKKDREMRLEAALSAADNSAMFAEALAQSQVLAAMDLATNMNNYYSQNIAGGTYNETVRLVDSQLPENRRGLRNGLAQQLLHQQMVDSQYKKGEQ